jgi:uncharacterized protein (TIGR03086 family)
MTETAQRLEQAIDVFDGALHPVREDQWGDRSPCSDWDVRTLVNHVVGETAWMPALLAGRTIAEVGGEFDGDLLGTDPCAAWHHWSALAHDAAIEPGAMARTVHLSYGDETAESYCEQVTADLTVHAWDLLRATGQGDDIPADLIAWGARWVPPMLEPMRGAGMLAPPLEVAADADDLTRLLGELGRDRNWQP